MGRKSKQLRAALANAKKGWESRLERGRKKEEKLERALARVNNLPPPIEDNFLGRRLLACKSILDLVQSVITHGRRCRRARMKMKDEERNGLASTITFMCKECKWEVSASSDSGDEKCSLNDALQWATVNIPVSFVDASSLFSCVDLPFSPEWFVKQEPEVDVQEDEDFSRGASVANHPTSATSQDHEGSSSHRCLICNKTTQKTGLNLEGITENNNTSTFLLGKMLQLPLEKLQEDVFPKFSSANGTIFCCDSCSTSVQNAFKIQKRLEVLEEKLRLSQKEFQTAISMSWRMDRERENINLTDASEILGFGVRKYVATGNWYDWRTEGCLSSLVYKQDEKEEIEDHVSDTILMEHEQSETEMLHSPDPESSAPGDTNAQVEGEVAGHKSHSERKYSCKMCPDLSSMDVKSFVQHILYHKRRPFQCTVCRNYLTGNTLELDAQPAKLSIASLDPSLKDHLCTPETLNEVNFQTLPIWSCEHCLEQFYTEEKRDKHETSCTKTSICAARMHACVTCKREFRTRNEWQIHRALNHPEVARFACHFCDAVFKVEASRGITDKFTLDRTAFMEHSRVCSSKHDFEINPTPYILKECEFCGKNCTSQLELERHVEAHHFVSKNSANCCPLCFLRRRTWNDLRNHMRSHMEPGSFTCDQCGQSWTRKPRLLEHCLRVHGMKSEDSTVKKCEHEGCTFETFYASTLTSHKMTTHGVERQHKCQFCGKGFLNLAHKRDHEMIHTNKQSKPYQCEICGNSFALRNYLYIHMRLSHQNRPFASTHKKKPPQKNLRKTDKSPQKNLPSPSATRNESE